MQINSCSILIQTKSTFLLSHSAIWKRNLSRYLMTPCEIKMQLKFQVFMTRNLILQVHLYAESALTIKMWCKFICWASSGISTAVMFYLRHVRQTLYFSRATIKDRQLEATLRQITICCEPINPSEITSPSCSSDLSLIYQSSSRSPTRLN